MPYSLGRFNIRNYNTKIKCCKMRRVTFEFDYRAAWKQIFGLNYNKVELVDALRCFKCDISGLAIVCKIKLKDKRMTVKDLVGKGLVTNVELLYRDKDGSVVIFIEGKSCVPKSPENVCAPKVIMSKPPEFLTVDRMKAQLIGTEKEVKNSSICRKMEHVQDSWADFS
jgi:hypothetical protein